MKEQQKNGIAYWQFDSLRDGRLCHAVFTRQGGVSPAPFASLNLSVSVPDETARVYENRRRAYGVYGRDTDTLVHAHLVHGADVVRVTTADYGTWPRADGLISDQPGCGLTMNYADCAPIFLYDPVNRAIGLGHAGWQGAVKDLPGALVRGMEAEFGSDPAQLVAAVGPCIGVCCYEVAEPVLSAVRAAFAEPESLLPMSNEQLAMGNEQLAMSNRQSPVHRQFDLAEANRRNLARAGVGHIELPGLCTACRTDFFFSHRAEQGRTGRFGVVLILD